MATTAFDVVGGDRSIVVARINGELRDLATEVSDGDVVEPVGVNTPEGLAVLRHSTAHVLAQAVQTTFPEAKLGIGPPIKDGFYYDFEVETPFTPDDLARLEKTMVTIIKAGQRFPRGPVAAGPSQFGGAVLGRPVPGAACARYPLHPPERLQADAYGGGVLARRPEE